MGTPNIIVDSNILIDVSRGIEQAIKELEEEEESHNLTVSVITQLELMVGCKKKKEFRELNTFMERFDILQVSEAISSKTVELFNKYRLSHDVRIAYMLIASTALVYDVELISKNQKDFRFIDDLKLIKYFEK